MTTTTSNAEIVREGYRRFAQADVEGVLGILDEAIRWTIPGPEKLAGAYEGRAGVLEFFGRLQQAYDRLEVRPQELIEDGDRVIVLGTHHGRGPGGAFEVGFAHVWELRDGKPVSFYEYTDTEALARALG